VTVDADDNVVLAGSQGGSGHLHVLRWLENGTVDTTFSGDGIVSIGFGVHVRSTTIAPDGAVLVAGWSSAGGFVARVLADGTFDSNFSTDGFATVGANSDLYSVVGDEAGGFIAAGSIDQGGFSSTSDLIVVRFDGDGSLDTAFADGGVYTYTPGISDEEARSVAIDGEGRIVVGGYVTSAN
jgi:uncharacterized delta-60 repeat protein